MSSANRNSLETSLRRLREKTASFHLNMIRDTSAIYHVVPITTLGAGHIIIPNGTFLSFKLVLAGELLRAIPLIQTLFLEREGTPICSPISPARLFEIAGPKPVPPYCLWSMHPPQAIVRKNKLCFSIGIPLPVSVTEKFQKTDFGSAGLGILWIVMCRSAARKTSLSERPLT